MTGRENNFTPVARRGSAYKLAAVVSLITLVIYLPALRNDFVTWDDGIYVVGNQHIRSLNTAFFHWAFFDSHAGNWYPLTLLSHALDYALWGLNPLGHHLTSILLHSANTFLVVFLIRMLLCAELGARKESGVIIWPDNGAILMAAGITGMLFGIHPLHVEPAVWVSGRKDLVSASFFLLSAASYISYATSSSIADVQRTRLKKGYFLTLLLFIFALSGKSMALTLPFVLLLFDWYPLRRVHSPESFLVVFTEKVPFLILSFIVLLVTYRAQHAVGAISSLELIPVSVRVLTAFRSLVAYIGKMVMPINLLPFYMYPEPVSIMSPEYFLSIAMVCGISIACLRHLNKHQLWLAVWGYYVVTLLPVLGIVQIGRHSMADRYAYLPILGPFFLAGLGIAWIWTMGSSLKRQGVAVKGVAAVVAVLLCGGMIFLTEKQVSVWKNSMVFWSYIIEKSPRPVSLAYHYRGELFDAYGQWDRAIDDFTHAITLDPVYIEAYARRGRVFAKTGWYDSAIEDFTSVIMLNPDYAEIYMYRGTAFGETGRYDRAISDFTRAITLRPDFADAYTGRGLALDESGQGNHALEDYDRAISLNPASADVYLNRGVAYERRGLHDRARADYDRAISINPSDYLIYSNRAVALRRLGLKGQAIEDYTKAISLNPDFADAYLRRGETYREIGDRERAMTDFQKACALGSEGACDTLRLRAK